MTNLSERAEVLLALVNVMRIARTLDVEQWLPQGVNAVRMLGTLVRPSPYRQPPGHAPGFTGRDVRITFGSKHVIKEYEAPGYALQDCLPVYEAIRSGLVDNTVTLADVKVTRWDVGLV